MLVCSGLPMASPRMPMCGRWRTAWLLRAVATARTRPCSACTWRYAQLQPDMAGCRQTCFLHDVHLQGLHPAVYYHLIACIQDIPHTAYGLWHCAEWPALPG